MRCCNDPSTSLPGTARDPSLHVNYTRGMILGVDDYVQEFAYLAGRSQRVVREFVGYGTSSGLAVRLEDTAEGPEIHVRPGTAAMPSGKLACVPIEQCGLINSWLARSDTDAAIRRLLASDPPPAPPLDPSTSPGPFTVPVYLTLCYAECPTLPVPIPGEPCRSEDSLMQPSRIADDYLLSLRLEPPPQTEEDAVRDFADWLALVPIDEGAVSTPANERRWIEALTAAAQPWFDAVYGNPPASPPPASPPPASPPPTAATLGDYMFGTPPEDLSIRPEDNPAFLRVAFRFWVTALRPMWSRMLCGVPAVEADDCLLLARLVVPIVWSGGSPTGAWQVVDDGDAEIRIDESRRPFLVHLRLAQEWQILTSRSPIRTEES